MVVMGSSCLQRSDGSALHFMVSTLANRVKAASGADAEWRVLNVLHRVSGGECLFSCAQVNNLFKSVKTSDVEEEEKESVRHGIKICQGLRKGCEKMAMAQQSPQGDG